MANRFPIIYNPSANQLQELESGDNLDLTSSGIYANSSLGAAGQVLTSNGTTVYWAASGGGGGGVSESTAVALAIALG